MVELEKLIQIAQEARERALTFRTSVGVAYETFDGCVFPGFNVEDYGGRYVHAEEVGLMAMLAQGYMGTDVKRMVEVYQDAGHELQEIFPACMTCWARLWQFTHPYLEIVVVNTSGKFLWLGTLGSLFEGQRQMGLDIYPSNKIRLSKPLLNFRPRLPLARGLAMKCLEDRDFYEYVTEVLKVE